MRFVFVSPKVDTTEARVDLWRGGKITLFSVRSTLYRTRLETLSVLRKSVEQLQIPASMAVTINQQQFLIYHMNNIVVYASPTGLQMLQQNSHWNADGTFKTAPMYFSQSYSIHVWDVLTMKPALFCALPRKTFEIYKEVLTGLNYHASNVGIILNPQTILIDFELGAYNAFSDVYPNAIVKGCDFHFTKNIWKRIKKLDLVRDCKKEEIRREIANIMSLPLLHMNELNNSMELIIDTLSNTDDKYIKLTDYVITTYISGKFDIQFWNLYDTTGVRPRTNNHVEGWHRAQNS
ncbi:unnamed protein product [Didymodactylos carnosus]|uniref:MULE transposase domain-containing protein n=1 Tax=Didymodactylos carnosus TaxID=1234261 RepID=A0A8S2D6I5_9BILA|nr:unnamed protein product [Didymodactylos carnosus]CAF3608151.1 unnamed protein product [Didymodactylos carnosus]